MMKLFCKNSSQLKDVNYFYKNAPDRPLIGFLNTSFGNTVKKLDI